MQASPVCRSDYAFTGQPRIVRIDSYQWLSHHCWSYLWQEPVFCEQSVRYFERSAVAKDATRLSDLAVAKQSSLQGPKSAQ
jgi:hypothetical protein